MADNKSGASHELGNLFVDIGSSGLGTLLKGLNSLSATFMLTKNAAQQFTKPIMDMSKNAGQGLVGLQKINAVTGLTIEQLQELQLWAKANSVDFGNYISQISNFQQNLLDIAMGRGNVSGLTILGLNPHDMDYRKPIEALEKIRKRVLEVDEATGAWALKELGLNAELLYQWKRKSVEINKNLILNKKEQQSLSDQNDAWNKLGATIDALQKKFIAQQTWIIRSLNDVTNWLTGAHPYLNILIKDLQEIAKLVEASVKGWGLMFNAAKDYYNLHRTDTLKDNPDDLTPEQKKKYNSALTTQGKKAEVKRKVTKEAQIALLENLTHVNLLPGYYQLKDYVFKNKKLKDAIKQQFSGIKHTAGENLDKTRNLSYDKLIGNTEVTNTKASAPNGALIAQEPLKDIPANISSEGNETLSLPSHLQNNQNIMTNNITVTQNITGDNAVEIASRSRDNMNDWFSNFTNSMERELKPGS